jgi:predicted NBD/HSP70 family sugar kinase
MYLLFDIGGTNMRIALSRTGQKIDEIKNITTPPSFEEGISKFKELGMELSRGEKIEGISGGIAGPLDKDKTMLIASPHIAGWVNKPLKLKLEEAIGASVKLENDSLLGGLGEAVYGAGKGKKIVAYIALGTGVGGARFIDGEIDKNSLGFEPGHQIIVPEGDSCNCGGRGHLESYVGGLNIEKRYQIKAEEISDPKVWDEIARYLAIGLNNTIVHWSPVTIVLGGSVARKIPLDATQSYLSQYLTIFPDKPLLVPSELEYPGLYGALKLLTTQP